MLDRNIARFLARRATVNEQLERTRNQVDAWVETFGGQDSGTLIEFALLEGLIGAQRSNLIELVELNDTFTEYLASLRTSLATS